MNIGLVNEGNVKSFFPFMNDEVKAYVSYCFANGYEGNLVILGLVDDDADNEPVGVLVCELDTNQGIADITTLFIKTKYRRNGYATELVILLCTYLSYMIERFKVVCTVTKYNNLFFDGEANGTGLMKLFSYLEFDEEKVEDAGCYYCTVGDLRDNEILKKKGNHKFKKLSEATRAEKSLLENEEREYLFEAVCEGKIDQGLSRLFIVDGEIKACALFSSDEKSITFEWGSVDSEYKMALVPMLSEICEEIFNTRDDSTEIYFPYINDHSKALVEKILKEHLKIAEENFIYEYSLLDTGLE